MKRLSACLLFLAAAGCGPSALDDELAEVTQDLGMLTPAQERGLKLFTHEEFKGNGRTCFTCHGLSSGTLSPAQVQARYQRNPNDPIFRPIDSDNGSSQNYSQLLARATVRVSIPLASNVSIKGSSARSVTLRRGIPTVLDTPSVDPLFMFDGREATLQSQALGAVKSHAQPGRLPTAGELNDIAAFEKVLFSNSTVRNAVKAGQVAQYPAGNTLSEKRGAAWFATDGFCGICHNPASIAAAPPEFLFASIGVSETNQANNPVSTYAFKGADGTVTEITSPDPGRALINGDPMFANSFKMQPLWNIKNTAPYFHDNSAGSLEAVVKFYSDVTFPQLFGLPALTAQEQKDIVAFMKLL